MRRNFSRRPLWVFLSYFAPYKGLFALDMACAAAVSAIDLVFPIVSRTAMQRYLPARMFAAFFTVLAVMLGAYLLKGVLYYVITVVGHGVGVLDVDSASPARFGEGDRLGLERFARVIERALEGRL